MPLCGTSSYSLETVETVELDIIQYVILIAILSVFSAYHFADAKCGKLEVLDLVGCPFIRDLTPLKHLAHLDR